MRPTLALAAALLGGAALSACSDSSTFVDPSILNCSTVRNYSIGSTASGTLDTGDCQLNDGSAVDYYRFTLSNVRTIQLVEQSSVVDPYLAILDENGNLVTEETLAGTGESEVRATLGAGTYYIAVSTYQPGDYGPYTLDSTSF
jgi:hypothetical protein